MRGSEFMSIEALMDHRCDIYHVIKEEINQGYGLPCSLKFVYGDAADVEFQDCHFNVKGGGIIIIQGEPQTEANGRIKLSLPIGTDIKLNDKVVSHESGLVYRAELPMNIRDHHIAVYLNREDGMKGAL